MTIYIIGIIFSILSILLGALVLYHNPKSTTNRAFFWATIWAAGVAGTIPGSFLFLNQPEITTIINKITVAFTPFLGSSSFYLALVFPRTKLKRPLLVFLLVTIPSLIIAGLAVGTDLLVKYMVVKEVNGTRLMFREIGPLYKTVHVPFFMSNVIAMNVILYRKYKRTTLYIEKKQIQYLFLGMGLALLFGATMSNLLPALGIRRFYAIAPPISILIFVTTTTYNIISLKAMEVSTIIHKTFIYFTASTIGVIFVFIIFLTIDFKTFKKLDWFLKTILGLIFFGLLYITKEKTLPIINKIMRRKSLDYQKDLRSKVDEVIEIIEIEELTKNLFKAIIDIMEISSGVFYLWKENTKQYEPILQEGEIKTEEPLKNFSEKDKLIIAMNRIKETVIEKEHLIVSEEMKKAGKELLEFMETIGAELVLVFRFEKKILGFIFLGKKETGKHYIREDIETLEYIGNKVSIYIYNTANKDFITKMDMFEQEMKMGANIQKNFLPERAPEVKGLDVYGDMKPSKMIGGDYFDFIKFGKRNLFIFVGDVSGKGIVAGFVMVMIRTALRNFIKKSNSLKEIAIRLNIFLKENTTSDIFLTGVFLYWSGIKKILRYLGCGHEAMLLYRAKQGVCERITTGGRALGVIRDIAPFIQAKKVELEKGDIIAVFTDGITEATNREGKQFGIAPIIKILEDKHDLTAKGIYDSIMLELEKFTQGMEQKDDYTLVIIKIME